jgi:hypothetical protein
MFQIKSALRFAFVFLLGVSPLLGSEPDFNGLPDNCKQVVLRHCPIRDAAHLSQCSQSFFANLQNDAIWQRCKYFSIVHQPDVPFIVSLLRFKTDVYPGLAARFEPTLTLIKDEKKRRDVRDATVILVQHPFFNDLLSRQIHPRGIDQGVLVLRGSLPRFLPTVLMRLNCESTPMCYAASRFLLKSTFETIFHEGMYNSGDLEFRKKCAVESFKKFDAFMRQLAPLVHHETTLKSSSYFLAESGPGNPLLCLNWTHSLIPLVRCVDKLPADQMESICQQAAGVAKGNLKSVSWAGESTPWCSTKLTSMPKDRDIFSIIETVSQITDLSTIPDTVTCAQELMTEQRWRDQQFHHMFKAAAVLGPEQARETVREDMSTGQIDDLIHTHMIDLLELDMHAGFF